MSDETGDPPLLLAIDDDATNLTLVRSVLSAYRVETCDGPEQALARLRDGLRPDLIVCDVTMPGMTGFELHARLRDRPELRAIPFVYLTALEGSADRRRGMGLGADDYLTKPFAPEELRRAVAARLARVRDLRSAHDRSVRIVSLGGVDVRIGERRVQWETRRAVELFLFLLANGDPTGAEVRRELWWHPPDGNQLHALVSRLRKGLAPHGTVDGGDGARLRLAGLAEVHWDVPAFERAADEALDRRDPVAVDAALGLYGGRFLPGAEGPWAEREADRLEGRAGDLHEAAIAWADGARRQEAERRYARFLGAD